MRFVNCRDTSVYLLYFENNFHLLRMEFFSIGFRPITENDSVFHLVICNERKNRKGLKLLKCKTNSNSTSSILHAQTWCRSVQARGFTAGRKKMWRKWGLGYTSRAVGRRPAFNKTLFYGSHAACYVWLWRCCLNSKRKQTYIWDIWSVQVPVAGQTMSPSSSVRNPCSGLNPSNRNSAKTN